MKMDLIELINTLYNLNFSSNTFADKKHEESVKYILKSNNFREIKKEDDIFKKYLKHRKNTLSVIEELKGLNLFIDQPFGSQKSPDFIICVDGFIIWIECKSGKGKITWNTGYPKKDIMVLFSCKRKNNSTLFFGQHTDLLVNNQNFESDYENFDRELKKLSASTFGNTFKSENFSFYMRKMLNDKTKYNDEKIRKDFLNKLLEVINDKKK
jgi:hypothetical protein